MAAALGYTVKLIGYSEVKDGKVLAFVSPRMVSAANPLCRIDGVFNGILVNANMVGDVMFYGPGAGKLPTASAVVADIIDIIANSEYDTKPIVWKTAEEGDVASFDEYSCARVFITNGACASLEDICEKQVAENGLCAYLTKPMTERDSASLAEKLGDTLVSAYRTL